MNDIYYVKAIPTFGYIEKYFAKGKQGFIVPARLRSQFCF